MLIRRAARPMLAVTFVGQGAESLSNPLTAARAAAPTADGLQKLPDSVARSVPSDPETLARLTAAAQIGGGLLLASGRLPRLAAAVLAATVVPANLGTHLFWREPDPERRAAQRRALLADVSLLGALLIAAADTAGRPSLGWRGRRAARVAVERSAEAADSAVTATRAGLSRLLRH